jgi:hypothetical protein
MGDCDRYKPYISDYLENSLDPSTQKDFENALKNSAELQRLTKRVRNLRSYLGNIGTYSCSDDFSLHLREKIHTNPEPLISRQNLVRLSFATSIVVVLMIALFSFTNLSDTTESPLPTEGTSDLRIDTPGPVKNAVSDYNPDNFKKDGEVEINTKMTQQVIDDSSKVNHLPDSRTDDRHIKHVDTKE